MNKIGSGSANTDLSLVQPGHSLSKRAAKTTNRRPERVSFDRGELQSLLNMYGRNVSAGLWCDYAMDFLHDRALFSIYRANSSHPIYVVEKNPKLRRKQGQYLVTGQQGRILKRGQVLDQVLRVLNSDFVVIK